MTVERRNQPPVAGVRFVAGTANAHRKFFFKLDELGLLNSAEMAKCGGAISFSLRTDRAHTWAPGGDTTKISRLLDLDTAENDTDLEREIVIAMLAAPRTLDYPSYAEFAAAVSVRRNIVTAARRTRLAFDTCSAERPPDFWTYTEERGFTVLPGKPLIAALQSATQPDASGALYSFSCYRATEYVVLLSLAQELARTNPPLLEDLQVQWETRAIMSRQFHAVFLHEYGSMSDPLPLGYFIPGDRLWFRNPDERSSDIAGYEGSWVFYLGGGLFSNFWKRDRPYTLETKCIEMYHWRHGAYPANDGEWRMDESIVEERVRDSLNDPASVRSILSVMGKLRDPKRVYAQGGCLDASREFPRRICLGTADIILPEGCGRRSCLSETSSKRWAE